MPLTVFWLSAGCSIARVQEIPMGSDVSPDIVEEYDRALHRAQLIVGDLHRYDARSVRALQYGVRYLVIMDIVECEIINGGLPQLIANYWVQLEWIIPEAVCAYEAVGADVQAKEMTVVGKAIKECYSQLAPFRPISTYSGWPQRCSAIVRIREECFEEPLPDRPLSMMKGKWIRRLGHGPFVVVSK